METRIQGVFPYNDRYQVVDIFGYSTKGLPGIEILGMGKLGRGIKEKFIFLSRSLRLSIPHRRYVICVELDEKFNSKGESDIQYLELPLLILFWTMAEQLPIRKLDDCFCSGKISVNGKVSDLAIKKEVLVRIGESTKVMGGLKYITPSRVDVPDSLSHLPLEGLLGGLGLRLS
ncbi:MAG: hypothetical protein KAG61_10415 [Bacteriovoracaceae bacterium]|nr:hypothetical protein [Bacteriovoracaceae bacterium]